MKNLYLDLGRIRIQEHWCNYLVFLVVAGEVGENARRAGHNVHICGAQQLNQTLQYNVQ
jgi:hypothetical protein